MSELKNFMARWSRRKRAAAGVPQTTYTSPCKGEVGDPGLEPGAPRGGQSYSDSSTHDPHPTASKEPSFDPAQLPPIESITAESDIRAFLAPGVPAELTRAALRRAWAADPNIRDFVGLAENAWDFNAAGAMPGFGPLEMTEELRRHIAQLLGDEVAAKDAAAPPSPPAEGQEQRTAIEKSAVSNALGADASARPPVPDAEPETSPAPSPQQASQRHEADISLQGEAKRRSPTTSITKNLHGRALPK